MVCYRYTMSGNESLKVENCLIYTSSMILIIEGTIHAKKIYYCAMLCTCQQYNHRCIYRVAWKSLPIRDFLGICKSWTKKCFEQKVISFQSTTDRDIENFKNKNRWKVTVSSISFKRNNTFCYTPFDAIFLILYKKVLRYLCWKND